MSNITPEGPAPAEGAEPQHEAGQAVGGTGDVTERSERAPAEQDPFRPASDPELDEGPKPPTTTAYGDPEEPGPDSALVIGEALVDIVARAGEEPVEHPGGSPANVALGLARLGRDVELVTWFGVDERGARLRTHLEGENVRLSAASARAPRTSTARADLDASGAATYVFDLDWSPPVQDPDRPPLVVHAGSIAAVLEPGAAAVSEMVDRHRNVATVTYDPNVRPQIMTDHGATTDAVERLVARTDLVKVSDEDLAWLYPEVDPLESARRWLGSGPAVVCVTRGGDGCWAGTVGGLETRIESPRVEVADTVGAGDSFMAALIDGLWSAGLLGAARRADLRTIAEPVLRRVLEHAARVAAITVTRAGANPPTRTELTLG
ncbi:carbohydrate kinase family protein [Georgenia alba]|uniref:Carbohydrate kinase n=1 Tax=Georgenia alba TaxID=2233858 RepID=A0ABW2Q8H5_9MICO